MLHCLVKFARFRQGCDVVVALQGVCETMVGSQCLAAPIQLCQGDDETLYRSFVCRVGGEKTVQRVDGGGKCPACDTQVGQFQQQSHPAALQCFTAGDDPV